MAIIYHDWINGDDVAGDGTASNPYKTFNRAHTAASNGDEIRVAKTPVTTVNANATWTYNSNVVFVSSNPIGIVNVGDVVSKPTGGGNGNPETAYYVTNVLSDRLVLASNYAGTSETTSSYLVRTPYNTGVVAPCTITKLVTYSGGWNLATQTRDGETWYSATYPGSTNNGLSLNNVMQSASHLNLVGSEYGISVTGGTLSYCTSIYGRYGCSRFYNGATVTNCVFSSVQTANYYEVELLGNVNRFHNNVIINTQRGVSGNSTLLNLDPTTNRNTVYFGSVGVYYNNPGNIGSYTIYNCTANGIIINGAGSVVRGHSIYFCPTGITFSNQLIVGVLITSCYIFGSTTAAINAWYSSNVQIENCIFENNAYDIINTDYTGVIYSTNNTHISPINYSYNKLVGGDVIIVSNCTIDPPSLPKAFTLTVNASLTHMPAYIFENSFGLRGIYYHNGSLMYTTEQLSPVTSTPTLKLTYNVTVSSVLRSYKIASCYVAQFQKKRLSIYYKTNNSGFSGNMIPVVKLNKKEIYRGTAIIPTTSWQQYQVDLPTQITQSGELSLEFIVNANTYPIFFGDFTVSNL